MWIIWKRTNLADPKLPNVVTENLIFSSHLYIPSLFFFSLAHRAIKNAGAKAIATALEKNTTLTKLE